MSVQAQRRAGRLGGGFHHPPEITDLRNENLFALKQEGRHQPSGPSGLRSDRRQVNTVAFNYGELNFAEVYDT